ncbi:hypothetical protein RF55_23359 [Lasius niger]|uniref:Uncharacterized protein n=1 Tax=Lasius niger TaxID=67767 RepID=A0A0J7MNZ6_LASNI|nr:hypothetical protein RF55_23359 [Lasius niger]
MAFTYDIFRDAISAALFHELMNANDETACVTLRHRILKQFSDLLGMELPAVCDEYRGRYRIDPYWAARLHSLCVHRHTDDKNNNINNNGNSDKRHRATTNNRGLLLLLGSKDLHTRAEIARTLRGIAGKDDDVTRRREMSRIFAIDGTRGDDPLEYLERLYHGEEVYSDYASLTYYRSIRALYDLDDSVSPRDVYETILDVFDLPEKVTESRYSSAYRAILDGEFEKVYGWAKTNLAIPRKRNGDKRNKKGESSNKRRKTIAEENKNVESKKPKVIDEGEEEEMKKDSSSSSSSSSGGEESSDNESANEDGGEGKNDE